MEELLELEALGWQALAVGGDGAVGFYDDILADDAIMLFPGALTVQGRPAILASMGGPPWTSYRLADQQVHPLGTDAAAVTYRVTAEREGQSYDALISSVYVRRDGRWRLALHQQTPA